MFALPYRPGFKQASAEFNYNSATGRAVTGVMNVPLPDSMTKVGATLTCEDCMAHFDLGIHFEVTQH
jgi:hypothetical protein